MACDCGELETAARRTSSERVPNPLTITGVIVDHSLGLLRRSLGREKMLHTSAATLTEPPAPVRSGAKFSLKERSSRFDPRLFWCADADRADY